MGTCLSVSEGFSQPVLRFIERLNIDNTQEVTTKKLRPLTALYLALIILTPRFIGDWEQLLQKWDVKSW